MNRTFATIVHGCGALSLVIGVSGWFQSPVTPVTKPVSVHAGLGDPVRAERIIRRDGYDVLYDGTRRNPLWVQYRVTPSDLEPKVDRPSRFRTDQQLPAAWRTYPDDYTNSGYDRAHMAPVADLRRNHNVAEDSMILSSVVAQSPGLHRNTWAKLDEHIRLLVEGSEEAIIASGPIFDAEHCAIGHADGILVAGGFWKGIAYRQNANWYVRFWVVGQSDAGTPLDRLIVTQQTAEQLCGFELFPALHISAETKRELSLKDDDAKQGIFALGGTGEPRRLAHFTLNNPAGATLGGRTPVDCLGTAPGPRRVWCGSLLDSSGCGVSQVLRVRVGEM